jgi:copper(I)-binding protein
MRPILPVFVLLIVVTAGACSSSGDDGIEVEDPWGRTSPKVVANGAFYMVLNGGETADRLVAADAEVCGTTELHQTIMNDGVMTMQQVEGGIDIPAGGQAILEPGGLHVMCINKASEFEVGDVIPVTLTFDKAEEQTVEAEIREG